MISRICSISLAALCAVPMLATAAVPAGEAVQRQAVAATCANCHGTAGRPPQGSTLPTLAGMPKSAFVERMAAFKAASSGPSVMHQIAKGFTESQIEQMATYFAQQQRP